MGAGGAHILATLNVSRRIAVEINQVAWNGMDKLYPNMIEKYKYPEDIPDDILDIVYSVSAIEHFECPLAELREMARKVKIGGKIVRLYVDFFFLINHINHVLDFPKSNPSRYWPLYY